MADDNHSAVLGLFQEYRERIEKLEPKKKECHWSHGQRNHDALSTNAQAPERYKDTRNWLNSLSRKVSAVWGDPLALIRFVYA